MVIVTQNQYILAQKIYHVVMDEHSQLQDIRSSVGRYRQIADKYFQITILYVPESVTQGNNPLHEQRECSVTIRGRVNAHRVFNGLIQQIREQLPDQMYLDKALERLLESSETMLQEWKAEDARDYSRQRLFAMEDDKDDRSTKKVRKPRKTKRRSKKVLRRAKKRN